MVLDVGARDILARTGHWQGPRGPAVQLPLLLETRAPGLGRGPGAPEAVLVPSAVREPPPGDEDDAGPLVVRDLGSAIRPTAGGADWADLELPAEHPLPPALAGEIDDVPVAVHDADGLVEVVHGLVATPDLDPPPESVEWVVLASAASLVGRPTALVDAVVATRERAGPTRVLYAPGTARPSNLSLLVYMGVDVVDDVQCHLEAARGRLLRSEHEASWGASGGDADEGHGDLVRENLGNLARELGLVREAVDRGALRELAEMRVRGEPWQVAALRRLDLHHHGLLASHCPVHRDAPLLATTRESLHRVEVVAWTRRLLERYSPPPLARVLLLLPCSARKPYSESRTHRTIRSRLRGVPNPLAVHEVVLTSPMGAVPRELERTYPAAQYDIPVTGEWFQDEMDRMERLLSHIRDAGRYDVVISHMGPNLAFVHDDPSVLQTRREGEGPTNDRALGRLADAVADAAGGVPKVRARDRVAQDVISLARFQFGPEGAEALMEGARVVGRYPARRVVAVEGGQLAAVVPSRGLLSLTLGGASLIAKVGLHRVWMDDFELRGDLFAVGVTGADADLRPGEEVAVLRGENVVAAGLARMPSHEMLAASRGIAVAVRHRVKGGDGS